MRTWIISDLHFNHANCIGYSNRPYKNIEEMNNDLIKKWNSKVGKEDKVFVLGDFAFGNITEIVPLLHGHKILIMGNHDSGPSSKYINAGFNKVINCPIILDGLVLSHRPIMGNIGDLKNIHGHMHWNMKKDIDENHYDASVERTNYFPVQLKDILKEKKW